MKGYYEEYREQSKLSVVNASTFFNSHYHNNAEIYLFNGGKYSMSVNDQTFIASKGSIIIADSYDVHGYKRLESGSDNDCKIIIIPYEYLTEFNRIKGDRRIKNMHSQNEELCEKLLKFTLEHIIPSISLESESVKKSAVEYFLSLILQELEFEKQNNLGSVVLIKNILSYIHLNFKNDITRSSISKELGYSEEHVSRVFKKFLKTSISKYLNDLRVDYVEKNKSQNKTLTELIFEAGFNSQRTYYRAKNKAK